MNADDVISASTCPQMEKKDKATQTVPRQSFLKQCSNWVINTLETSFYRLGFYVARYPWLTIIVSVSVCGLCGIGLDRFQETKDDAKLWVPQYSRVIPEKNWVEKMFPEKTRYTSMIVEAANVLSPWTINAMFDIYEQSLNFKLEEGETFETMCVKVGPACHVSSLLEIWSYNKTRIKSLSINQVVQDIKQNISYSPVYGTQFNLRKILSGIRYDRDGNIIGARTATITWLLHKDEQWEKSAMEWEKNMIDLANGWQESVFRIYVYATRTFDDEGYGAVNADISLLTAGFIIVFIFVIVVLGRFNLVEHKLYLSLAGILSIGLAILFSYGIAMSFGLLYGPIHALMPFLLLGIGVDDMFVIVEAWRNLTEEERKLPLEDRVASALKHAGVSITVTSITDIVAFGIGGSTVIPALSAFCGYAALGIMGLYLLVSTFFVACLTLDQLRIEKSRDGILFCHIHKDYQPNKCSQMDIMPTFIERFYAPTLMKNYVKVFVLLVALALAGVNIWSFTQLRQDFDLYNYLPSTSYGKDYVKALQHYYPDTGEEAAIYCDGMNYYHNKRLLTRMLKKIDRNPYVKKGSVDFWFKAFVTWLKLTSDPAVTMQLDEERYPLTMVNFDTLLLYFLQQREGRSYGRFLKFSDSIPPRVVASYSPIVHTWQKSSAGDIVAMDSLRKTIDNAEFPDGRCFSYGFKYLNNETNKVLQGELYRNLALAAACVFLITLILIANFWTSLMVFSCVVFTVVDVTGSLQFMGVTIDTASSILIILCVGLAVDYSAHIGHTFMTISGQKEERARATLKQIGPAVLNGGFSTFLAFVLLVDSNSYGFVLFFRVFMTVVIFGLFHGLVYLPVVLSLIGPKPYESAEPAKSREATLQQEGDCVIQYKHGDRGVSLVSVNGVPPDQQHCTSSCHSPHPTQLSYSNSSTFKRPSSSAAGDDGGLQLRDRHRWRSASVGQEYGRGRSGQWSATSGREGLKYSQVLTADQEE